ncbi:MAG: hypothetical protein IPN71_07985 [Fibrobacteres bacterium]|nr:hypothetical protein [Fibrobacterota bacterium]
MVHRSLTLLTMIATLALLPAPSSAAAYYGREALAGLRQYGVAVRVVCTGALEQHQEAFTEHVKRRLEARKVQIVDDGSVALKLFVSNVQSSDGLFVVHMRMELCQSSYLGSNNKIVDAPTWDAWKMGEYREDELLSEVDDLSRQFLNDYIAAN